MNSTTTYRGFTVEINSISVVVRWDLVYDETPSEEYPSLRAAKKSIREYTDCGAIC